MTRTQRVIGAAALVMIIVAAALVLLLSAAGSEDEDERYRVHIMFNQTVADADMAEADALLRDYDPDVDMAVLESFPPQGSAIVESEGPKFCDEVVARVESKSYVESASCDRYEPTNDGGDEPVSTLAE